jgi:hypothetical protein
MSGHFINYSRVPGRHHPPERESPAPVLLHLAGQTGVGYAEGIDPSTVELTTGDPFAFRTWADNSAQDQKIEADFWRGYIGSSRKRLAQAINFIYPQGYTWSEDPSKWIEKFVPVNDLRTVLEDSKDRQEELTEIEWSAIARFQQLRQGQWFDIARPDSWADANAAISQANKAASVGEPASAAQSKPAENARALPPLNPQD